MILSFASGKRSEAMGYRIAIAGGGLGGLTAALALGQGGHEVIVLEQATAHRTAGAGIQLSPNASRVLLRLGLGPTLEGKVTATERSRFRHFRTGRTITEARLGGEAEGRYGAPYWQIHRADLHEALQTALAAVTLLGVDGPVDLLLGADGIHSEVRRWCFGEAPARFTGQVAWRFLVPSEGLPPALQARDSQVWWGPGKHFVHYPVDAGARINGVAVVEAGAWTEESWALPGQPEDLRTAFRGWHPELQQLLERVTPEGLFQWGLFDRAPLPRWHRGPVALLGDACHPTLPFLAQGAAMAIEDSAALTLALAQAPTVSGALAVYEGWRRSRTARIQQLSRRYGWVYHLGAPLATFRNLAAPLARGTTMDWLYRYDVEDQIP
ncbi:MAG: FAD-binding protein [Gammaproteobacteria bacterium]|nr:FAD-binding protein [Gammaproteobacteria bacterium]